MRKTGSCTRYGTIHTFAILLLVLSTLLADPASAQDCDPAKQRIYHITDTRARQSPDSLEVVLGLATLVRDCEQEVSSALEVWLLDNEVFALEGLQRYDEAAARVDHFFEAHFGQASGRHRARFYLWRLKLQAFWGEAVDMVVAYTEAQRYASALDATGQAYLRLDGAYAYREINALETALRLVREARALIGEPETYEDSLALAYAIRAQAETHLRLGTQFSQAKDDFRAAARLYGTLGEMSQVAITTTLLGETYAAEGDTSRALAELALAIDLAKRAGSARSTVAALYRLGQMQREQGALGVAEATLKEALEASDTVREFDRRLLYQLALLYEQRHQFDEAAHYYRAIVAAPKPSGFVAMLKAQRQREIAQARLALIESRQTQQHLHLALVGLLLLVALTGSGLVFLWRRPRRLAEILQAKSNGSFVPRRTHTGHSLDQLIDYFRDAVESPLFGLHLAYIFATLFEPELILPYLDDPWHIEHVKQGTLPTNAALFRCVAAAEEALIEGQRFGKNPANTIGSYLNAEFGKRGWVKPANPSMWREYFVAHHMEDLL